MSRAKKPCWIPLAAAVACFGNAAFAQIRPEAGGLLEQEQQRDRTRQLPSGSPVLAPVTPAKPALPPSSTLKVAVTEFRFIGNNIIPSAELSVALQGFVGKTLSFDELNNAAVRVQRYYRDRGYFLAVAYLPQQQISGGVVEIAVLEGRLGSMNLQMAPGAKLKQSFVQGVLDSHLKPGDAITEAGLERPLLLLRDLPNVELSSAIGPNKSQVGAADVTVKINENPRLVTGYVDYDNGGNRFTGEHRFGVNLNAGNFTGYGDLLSLRGFISDENMNFGRVSYLTPLMSHGTRLGVSYTYFDYKLAKNFADLQAHGEGAVGSLFVIHPFMRTRNANFMAQFALEEKRLEDRIDTTGLIDNKQVSSIKLGGVGDFRDGFFSGGLNSYSLTLTQGRVKISNAALLAADQAIGTGLRTSGEFTKYNADARRLQRISDDFSLLMAVSAQVANKNLTSSERFSLGGPNGVRAYPVGEAPGDTGYLFTAEMRYAVPNFSLLGGELTASVFYDMGSVRTNKNTLIENTANIRSLAGAGFGLSLGSEGRFIVRGSLATPTEKEKAISDGTKRDPRGWIQAIKWF